MLISSEKLRKEKFSWKILRFSIAMRQSFKTQFVYCSWLLDILRDFFKMRYKVKEEEEEAYNTFLFYFAAFSSEVLKLRAIFLFFFLIRSFRCLLRKKKELQCWVNGNWVSLRKIFAATNEEFYLDCLMLLQV